MKNLFTLLLLACTFTAAIAQGNNYIQDYTKYQDLAMTPPMGWNSWNKFACNINEELVMQTADALVATGMRDAGYIYINIDDCWHGDRDEHGFIHPDSKRFPSGMKALADYVHSKGLKIGIYSDAGSQTCGGRPGSRGYEFQDAHQYAAWGIDYLKYDWCNTEGLKAEGAYKTISAALKKAGRPMVLSICEWGNDKPWEWAQNIGHLWRTTGDIYNCFDCIEDHGTWKSWGTMQILDKQDGLRKYAGPGHWNDPDMLEVGNGNLTPAEDRAHFTMWCMLAAPLMAGNDIRTMTKETIGVLTNKEAIDVNQDPLGIQGYKLSSQDGIEIWYKPLSNGDWAVAFLNRSEQAKEIKFDWQKNEWIDEEVSKRATEFSNTTYNIRDIWSSNKAAARKGKVSTTSKVFHATVNSHDVLFLRLIKTEYKRSTSVDSALDAQ